MFTMDFYAYWNADQVASLLRAVVGITSSKGYGLFLACSALLGFLCVTAASAVKSRGVDMVFWFVAVILFYFTLFVPKVNVTVQDPRTASAQTVEGLPLGVGFTAALSSQIGHWAAELFETAMTDVDAQKFTSFGAVFPERAAAAIAAAGPIRPETRQLLDPWIERCVIPELLESDAKMTELLTSADLTETVFAAGWTNPARFIMIDNAPLSCTQAGAELLQVIRRAEIPAQEKLLVAKLTQQGGTGSLGSQESAVLEAAVKKAVPEAAAAMLGVSKTLSESLSHALLLSEIPAGAQRAAASMEMPIAGAVALAKAQGNLASEISFRTMSELAAAFLPKLRNLLEFILIAAFPLVMGMLAASGTAGSTVARMYLTLFFWLALWAPIAAVINWLLIHIDANPMNRLTDLYGGLTLEAADLIRNQGATSQAMAGYLMLLVPLISYLIAKASDMGAASLAASVMSPASSAAQSQSAQISMGNIASGNASLGNVSANNASANKSDISTSFAAGTITKTTSAAGTVVRDAATGAVTSISAVSSDLGVSASSTLTEGRMSSSSSAASSSVTSDIGAASGTSAYFRSESGASGSLSQTAGTASSRLTASGETLAAGQSSSSTADARRTSTLTEQSAMTESFGIDSGLGGRFAVGGSESAEKTMNDNLAGTLMSNPPSALLSGMPRQKANAGQSAASGGLGGADELSRASGLVNAGGNTAGQPSGPQGDMHLRGRHSFDAGFHAGSQLRVNTQTQHAHSAANGLTAGQTQADQESLVYESRSQQGTESRMQTGSQASSMSVRSAASGSAGESSRTTSSHFAEASQILQRAESNSGLSRAAGARMDTYLAQAAVRSFGSPEEALEALRDPATRAAFARDALSGTEEAVRPMRRGPSSAPEAAAVSAARMVQTFGNGQASVEAAALEHAREGSSSRIAAENFGSRSVESVSSQGMSFTQPIDLKGEASALKREELAVSRGAAAAAAALWEERHSTAESVFSTALANGIFYKSPQDVYGRLQAAAQADPETKSLLKAVGDKGSAAEAPKEIEMLGLKLGQML